MSANAPRAVPGIHHVAYATRDTAATVRFYEELLGFPLVNTEIDGGPDGFMRHLFFDTGDGVCIAFITQKIGLRQPTVTAHMHILADAGLVSAKQIKNWVFYKPNRPEIAKALAQIAGALHV